MKYPCLPLIQERFWNKIKDSALYYTEGEKRIYPEFDVIVFSQIWGSTALGFDGIGGQAMTSAYTTVIQEEIMGVYGVFFGNSLAYIIENPSDEFFEDIKRFNMKPVNKCSAYKK